MSTKSYTLKRDADGRMWTPFDQMAQALAEQRGAERGTTAAAEFSAAMAEVYAARPDLYDESELFKSAARDHFHMNQFTREQARAWAEMERTYQADTKARFAAQAPEPQAPLVKLADKFLSERFANDPARYSDALELAGRTRPEYLAAYMGTGTPGDPAVDVRASTAQALDSIISGMSAAQQAAALRELARLHSPVLIPALQAVGVDVSRVEAALADLEARIAPAVKVGGNGQAIATSTFSDRELAEHHAAAVAAAQERL